MTELSFQDTVDAARSGDEMAATKLVAEYLPELQRYIRFRLTYPGLRRFLDSLDVCQSVLAAFFVRLQGGQLDIVQPRQLFRLLAVMAENKIRDNVRRHRAIRRGAGALDRAPPLDTVDRSSPEPGPAEVAADRELVTALRDRLPAEDRLPVDLWLEGHGWNEIGAAVGSTPEAVRKRVTRSIDRAARDLGLIETAP